VNGVHDMGGTHGFGPVNPEPDEPVFHAEWERRVHALVIASPTRGNIDAGRHQRELIPGPEYLQMTYYERWFAALCAMLLQGGAVTAAEMASGVADPGTTKASPRLAPASVAPALSRSGSFCRDAATPPIFKAGDRVRARNLNPTGHTRLPRYVRGREGVIKRCHGAHVFPDRHAHGGGEDPRPLYTVRFSARELWGSDAAPRDSVSLDLWEPYLERA
jgi:nitrile hydratase subunit beta